MTSTLSSGFQKEACHRALGFILTVLNRKVPAGVDRQEFVGRSARRGELVWRILLWKSGRGALGTIEFPLMRRAVIVALADLADADHQTPDWFWWGKTAGDSLHEVVHVLYDDMAGFPHPADRVGTVLVSGVELERLQALADAMGPVLDAHAGDDMSSVADDPRWVAVRSLVASALMEMIHNGGSGMLRAGPRFLWSTSSVGASGKPWQAGGVADSGRSTQCFRHLAAV